jgi:hypothetical protein
MNITHIGFNDKTVVFLGAGATRGASFVKDSFGALPPLDRDFFTQAQRMSAAKPRFLLETLIRDVVGMFGSNFSLTMEGYLTRLEQLSNVLSDYRFRGWQPANRFQDMRENFLQVLAALLDEAIRREPKCLYHRRLVEQLSREDVICSLNYDWLIDYTLMRFAANKWNPKTGYGVYTYSQGRRGAGTRYWACKDASDQPIFSWRTIYLLKLHGSMNWFPVPSERNPPRLELRQRWWHQKGRLKFEIAPPEWNKPTRSGVYVPVWRKARNSLINAKALIFVGYSLPETDLPVQALLTVERSPQPLKLLVIVNPDQEARQRIRSVLYRRLDQQTRILSFDYLRDFYRFLKPAP